MPEIKDIIRERRTAAGLTMKELANKIGVSEGTVSRWESGHISNMKRDKVALLSQILDIPLELLMGWDEKEQDATKQQDQNYYINDDARDIAQFLFENPEYRILFDASRKVKKEDLVIVKELLDRFS